MNQKGKKKKAADKRYEIWNGRGWKQGGVGLKFVKEQKGCGACDLNKGMRNHVIKTTVTTIQLQDMPE